MNKTQIIGKYPAFRRVPQRDNTIFIIIMIVLVAISAAVAFVIYIAKRSAATTTSGRCEPGLCKFNLLTGVKTCPASNTEQVLYNIALEGCSSRNYCQDPKYSNAVLTSGLLNPDGVCNPNGIPGNEACSCVSST